MNISFFVNQLQDAYEGDPWFGRNAVALLSDAGRTDVFNKPSGEHSIVELVWHMVNWRRFVINALSDDPQPVSVFEKDDWRAIDPSDKSLWKSGLDQLQDTQTELLVLMQQQEESILQQNVPGRSYTYLTLFSGIVQHDIYHLGQIAYVTKMLRVI
ncbi:MAG TPA: DinB family protein [Flavisolibacter sp.]